MTQPRSRSSKPSASRDESLRALEARLDPERLPAHVAVIMDGNGRWAQQRGWGDRIRGHQAGIDSVRAVTEEAARLGIRALTLYAFSRENWARPRAETSALMRLLRRFLVQERPTLRKNDIRLVASGSLDDLPAACRKSLDKTAELTAGNAGMTLNLALSYSGREEIAEACRRLARQVARGELDPGDIDPERISANLYRPELGDPDLLIRSSGELRVSNFLLWQIAYAELYVTPTLWPDFREQQLVEALLAYQQRDRRFGKVKTR